MTHYGDQDTLSACGLEPFEHAAEREPEGQVVRDCPRPEQIPHMHTQNRKYNLKSTQAVISSEKQSEFHVNEISPQYSFK